MLGSTEISSTVPALKWITEVLRHCQIPYVISGGFAAKIYGATRKLNDIDIDIPDEAIWRLAPKVKSNIVYGPCRHKDGWWDLLLMTLEYDGQLIDIAGGNDLRIRNPESGRWEYHPTDFDNVLSMDIGGVTVPIMNSRDLLRYKRTLALGWAHQARDVSDMLGSLSAQQAAAR